jgi:hypothetical protein
MAIAAVIALFILGLIVRVATWPGLYPTIFRQMLRQWPEAREAYIGDGKWVAFSKRFGWPYVIGAVLIAVSWYSIGLMTFPDTKFGFLLLFIPSMVMFLIAVVLGILIVCRWMVDE